MIWNDNETITIEPPKRPKKITGTRLGAILGLNKWSTPFEAWCAITKTWEKPFTDTIYTEAGKAIEPILIDYVAKRYFMDVKTPEDVYGKDFFKKTFGDFFSKESKVFGGMWDAITDDTIIEIKTTKRAEDWVNDIPEYYKLQANLYAWLKGYDKIIFCCGFLTDEDYKAPERFKPKAGKNVVIREYKLSEAYPNFEQEYIKPALEFWEAYVKTGNSPVISDTKTDKEIVAELRKATINDDKELSGVITHIEDLMSRIEAVKASIEPLEKELKKEQEKLKDYLTRALEDNPNMDKAEIKGANKIFTVSKSVKNTFDEKSFKKDNEETYNRYLVEKTSYTLRNSNIKEEK